jgi:hypothetical protein
VDGAFLSRADIVEHIATPAAPAIRAILVDTIAELSGSVEFDGPAMDQLAGACAAARMDARQVRKLVLRAVCSSRELALAPERLGIDQVAGVLAESSDDGAARS